MKVKNIVVEDFCNYKQPSMFIVSAVCDFKCCKQYGFDTSICQNSSLTSTPTIEVDDEDIFNMFISNNITKSVVIGGLEPFLQFNEVLRLIDLFRRRGEQCDFIIYTGYYPNEIQSQIDELARYTGIIIKFGRYIPNTPSIFDPLLGINLASDNQFSVRVS